MDEAAGRKILRRRFEAAGFPIHESYRFESEGVSLEIDGFDPATRVGYEYLTTAAGDREDVTPEEIARLDAWNREGKVHVLLIDEVEGLDEGGLEATAELFLAELRRRYRSA